MGTTTAPHPACDSCCPEPPPVDEDKIACAALDKRLMILEDAMRDADCSTENADDETMRVEQELGNEGIMDTCKCEAWKQLKEELMVSVELVCEDSRKGKNQCITPLGQILWWRFLHCRSLNFV